MSTHLKRKGMGARRMAMHPRTVEAILGLRTSNIWVAKRGNPAPKRDRQTVLAARQEAAWKR